MSDSKQHLYSFQAYDREAFVPSIHIAGRHMDKTMIAPYELVQSISFSTNRAAANRRGIPLSITE